MAEISEKSKDPAQTTAARRPQVLRGHHNSVLGVSVSADGSVAVSGGNDKTVRVWNLKTGKCTAVLEGHTDSVRGVSVAGVGNLMLTLRLATPADTPRLRDLIEQSVRALSVGYYTGPQIEGTLRHIF